MDQRLDAPTRDGSKDETHSDPSCRVAEPYSCVVIQDCYMFQPSPRRLIESARSDPSSHYRMNINMAYTFDPTSGHQVDSCSTFYREYE